MFQFYKHSEYILIVRISNPRANFIYDCFQLSLIKWWKALTFIRFSGSTISADASFPMSIRRPWGIGIGASELGFGRGSIDVSRIVLLYWLLDWLLKLLTLWMHKLAWLLKMHWLLLKMNWLMLELMQVCLTSVNGFTSHHWTFRYFWKETLQILQACVEIFVELIF